MEAARKIVDAELLLSVMDLPESMKKRKVEVIVLPVPENGDTGSRNKMKGFLQNYANPDLIAQEKNAWREAAAEKHAAL